MRRSPVVVATSRKQPAKVPTLLGRRRQKKAARVPRGCSVNRPQQLQNPQRLLLRRVRVARPAPLPLNLVLWRRERRCSGAQSRVRHNLLGKTGQRKLVSAVLLGA